MEDVEFNFDESDAADLHFGSAIPKIVHETSTTSSIRTSTSSSMSSKNADRRQERCVTSLDT